jgi:starch phosphorylase
VEAVFADGPSWARKAALNIARMGAFSSDRTMREYAGDIWRIEPVDIEGDGPRSMM